MIDSVRAALPVTTTARPSWPSGYSEAPGLGESEGRPTTPGGCVGGAGVPAPVLVL